MQHAQNLIAGEWTGTAGTERHDPAHPDQVVATAPALPVCLRLTVL